MNKNEILERSRQENAGFDEREQSELGKSFGFGAVAIAVICIFFSITKALQGESFFEFGTILFGYLSAMSLYNYTKIKQKYFMISGLACAVTAVNGVLGYFLIG